MKKQLPRWGALRRVFELKGEVVQKEGEGGRKSKGAGGMNVWMPCR